MKKWLIIFLLLPVFSWASGDTLQVAASTDDAEIYGASSIYLTLTGDYIGRGATGGSYYSGWRWQSCPIPQGAVVDSAILYLYADSTLSATTCNVRFKFQDEDDASTYSTKAIWDTITLTDAYTDSAIGGWTTGNWYRIVVTSSLQEVVNRPGYAQGNDIALRASDNSSSTNAKRRTATYDQNSALAAQLRIYWKDTELSGQRFTPTQSEFRFCPTYAGKRVRP